MLFYLRYAIYDARVASPNTFNFSGSRFSGDRDTGWEAECYFCNVKNLYGHLAYFLYWLFYFTVSRAIFLVYHHARTAALSTGEILRTFAYGCRMDLSFTSYLCIFPFLLLATRNLWVKFPAGKIIRIYTLVLIWILSFLMAADLGLYAAWGYRMDVTPLVYLTTPKEMAASAASSPVILLLSIFIACSIGFVWLYRKTAARSLAAHPGASAPGPAAARFAISLFLVAVLFIPIRGGIQKIPMNLSDVYFSQNSFANHAAINLPWNIMFSALNNHNGKNPYHYFSGNKDELLVDSLYRTGPPHIPSILSVKRPNIVFIILESYTAKFIGCLGGEPGVTPHLDSMANDGLLFTNIYAAGDRSEKGQVAILSGYPNQAITSIIKTPVKTQRLPSITAALEQAGYQTSYSYGGELEFANIKSYLLNIHFGQLISKYSFPAAERTTSWGVHDGIVLDTFFNDLHRWRSPFFATLFTLSSHEPFDVPFHKFPGKDVTGKFRNAFAYTDSCLGVFMDRLRKDPLWNNTLVVLVADHGHELPGYDRDDVPSRFHIPLLFTGGALRYKGRIATIGSQTDIVTTVLDQLGLDTRPFKWGKDLLDSSAHSFAFYCFNNGFGFVTPQESISMDNVSGRILYHQGIRDAAVPEAGKAYMQFSYQDFLKR